MSGVHNVKQNFMDEIIPDLLDADELDSEETLFRELHITADRGQAPVRIDKFLVDHVGNTSRSVFPLKMCETVFLAGL